MKREEILDRIARIAAAAGPDGCWEWDRYRTPAGYGQVRYDGRNWFAHRVVYTLLVAAIPDGLLACHHCDNPPCCNPKHIYPGTKADNGRDAYRRGQLGGLRRAHDAWRGRRRTHCKRGHELTPENVHATGKRGQHRNCKTCSNERVRKWKQARKAEMLAHLRGGVVEVGAKSA